MVVTDEVSDRSRRQIHHATICPDDDKLLGMKVLMLLVLSSGVEALNFAAQPRSVAGYSRISALRCSEGEPEEAPVPEGFCAQCGSELFPNCNGEGRVVGGLTAIDVMGMKPFEWWPIKVRCCNRIACCARAN